MSDAMLLAILEMPKDLAMSDELSRHQYWQAGQRAAHEILQARAEVERLREVLSRISVEPGANENVSIALVSNGDKLFIPNRSPTYWSKKVLTEFEQARRKALEGSVKP